MLHAVQLIVDRDLASMSADCTVHNLQLRPLSIHSSFIRSSTYQLSAAILFISLYIHVIIIMTTINTQPSVIAPAPGSHQNELTPTIVALSLKSSTGVGAERSKMDKKRRIDEAISTSEAGHSITKLWKTGSRHTTTASFQRIPYGPDRRWCGLLGRRSDEQGLREAA